MAKFFFKKDRSGLPIAGSNIKATRKPSTAHIQVTNVIIAPTSISFKPTFAGNERYFVQYSENGELITGSLMSYTSAPEGMFLELFKNNVITLPLEANENSGVVDDSAEDIANVPMYMSEDFIQNGYRTTGKL